MKKFLSEHITERNIQNFALSNVRKRGVLKRVEIEEVQFRFPVFRPLKRIHFYDGLNVEVSTSLIDEELSGLTIDFNEHILLWRPLYFELTHPSNSLYAPKKIFLNLALLISPAHIQHDREISDDNN